MGRDIFIDYNVPFAGLKEGLNNFRYEIDSEFFKKIEGAEPEEGANISVDMVLDKGHSFLTLYFYIGGSIKAICDRCNNEFRQELLDEYKVYVKFSDHAAELEEEDDVVYLNTGDTQINVAKLLYEFVLLSIPMQKICPPNADGTSGCNENVIKLLEHNPQEDNNTEEETDPRWSALKKLK